ncbi:TPA: hypothetical protein DHT42_01010 [Candidatus Nomurabacteria bacterium]|nr:hypothetical protein [Candidatus Nomurabacteria bacterium]
MNWFFIALVAPFLWAFVNIADSFLISKYSQREKERSSGGLVIFSSLIGIFIAFLTSLFMQKEKARTNCSLGFLFKCFSKYFFHIL